MENRFQNHKDIELLKDENGYRLLKVGSGTYEFLSM
jgi:hypothetical protein